MKSPGTPYLLAAAETGLEEPVHLSSALIPGGREGRQGAGPHPEASPAPAAAWAVSQPSGGPTSIGRSSEIPPRTRATRREPWRAGSGMPLAPDQQAESREDREGKLGAGGGVGVGEDLEMLWRGAWEERPGGNVGQERVLRGL